MKNLTTIITAIFLLTSITTAQNYSLSFDGSDDYVTIPKSGTLNLEGASAFTLQVYINNDALPGSPTWRYLISNTGTLSSSSLTTYGGYILRYGADGGAGPYSHMFSFQTSSTHHVSASEVMAYETWQELSIVYDGSTLEYYYDGVSVGSHSITGNFDDYDGDITLGKGATIWGTKYFPGKFDDLRIWNIALTQSQILSYMTTSPTGNETGLVGYWNFNEGEGTTLTDLSGNGNHGTINGATWSTDVPPTIGEVSDDDVFVEEITVLATQYQALESIQLENGKEYYLKVTGSYSYGSQNCMDAAYHYCTWNNPVDPSPGRVWTWNSSNSQRPYPDVYNSDHVYYFYFTSDGTTEEFGFEDGGGYGDNSGSLTIQIWQRPEEATSTNTYSLSFDGSNDYVRIGTPGSNNSGTSTDIGSLLGNGSFSVSFWYKSSTNPGSGDFDFLLDQRATQNNGDGWEIQNDGRNSNKIYVAIATGASSVVSFRSSSSISTGRWYHIALTWDGSNGKIYINGSLETTQSISSRRNNSVGMVIGSRYTANERYLSGGMDEVAIWNIALTESQIQSYMSSSPSGNETGLVGYWNFNEGSGTTLTDLTSNGNDGTIYGATWSTDVPFSGTTTTSALTWSVQAKASLGSYNDNDNYLGVASSATNTFDAAYDEVEPPVSPGSSISLYFPHPEWNSILGDNFSTDARPEIALTDTMQVWDFEVVSTDAGDATLTFVFSDVPSVPVILENTATGVRQTLTNNATYTFTAVADSAHPFKISIGDTTAPSLALGASCSGPAILNSDSTKTLNWTTTDGFTVDSIEVWFSSDSGTTYNEVASIGGASSYNWTVPDTTIIYNGMLKIKSKDYAGNTTEKFSDYIFAVVGDSISAAVTSGWNLWSVPIDPTNDTMTVNLNDDFTDYWVTYDYVNNGYTYNGILKEAEGYWLGAAQNAIIDVKGTALTSDETMSLSQGWDLVSNPLVLNVSVDSLQFTKNGTTNFYADAVTAGWVNSVYGYSGSGYEAATTFQPWKGYWIGVLETGVDMTFPIHRHDGSGSARSRENDWMITFDAQVDGANDGTTMIGYAETATDGFDAQHDAVQPPNPPGPDYVSLFIAHPEWNYPLGDKFAKDIRASVPDDEYKEWLLSIESSESNVQLNWTLMNIPDDYEVGYTIDDGIYFNDMRSVGTINISADTEIIVRVGSQVLGIDDETIPDVYALQQNYPNPFNPITTLRYDLPEQANVNIIIYDMLGRQVKSLINQTQDAGFKSVIWNATNDYGKPVSAGVYLYQIRAGEFVQTRKMVLLK